ncbi:MAG: dihydrofolate reductase [Clostridia bacterium]|nr:dihydrofolate reductase [Clostridia bacterium]MBQ6937498.1 dihydrofolate reductase [Clostridia bacterium]
MKMIVCVSENFGIGKGGDLLFSLPPDMKFFRETTLNKVVVMGRSTLDSFPGGKPLKNRTNVVISRDKSFSREGATVFNSKEDVLSFIKKFDTDDVYVIGGAQIYEMFRDECDTALVTKVEKQVECDKFFFDIDSDESWQLVSQSEKMEYEGTEFSFCTYKNLKGGI